MANLSQEQQMQLLAELEIEMMSDMYNRWVSLYNPLDLLAQSLYT